MGADLTAIVIPLLVVFVFAIVQSIVGVGLGLSTVAGFVTRR